MGLEAAGGGAREGAGRDWRRRRAESAGSQGGGPGSDGPACGLLESVRSAPPGLWSLCSWALGDGERSRIQSYHGGTPGPCQGRPERPRRLLLPGPAQVAAACAQTLAAGEPVARAASLGLGGGPGPWAIGLSAWEVNLVVEEAAVSTPEFLPSPPGAGALPSAAQRATPYPQISPPLGRRMRPRARECVRRAQEMRRRRRK